MRVVGVIPARYRSSRFEGKPLASIGGRPMIERVYERAAEARLLSELLVATDDERIAAAVRAFGGRVAMTSPDHLSGTDRVAEAARDLPADVVVNIQGDEPFLAPRALDELVEPFASDSELPMATLCRLINEERALHDPNVVKVVVNRAGDALYFSRSLIPYPRRAAPHAAREHIGVYAFRKDFLFEFARLQPTALEAAEGLEQLRALEHGRRIRVVETKSYVGLSVDTPADLARAEAFWQAQGGRG